jgi:hypothetical protein
VDWVVYVVCSPLSPVVVTTLVVVIISTLWLVEPVLLGGGVEIGGVLVPVCDVLDELVDDERLGVGVGVGVGVLVGGVEGLGDGVGGGVTVGDEEVGSFPVPVPVWRFWIAAPLRKGNLPLISTTVASATDSTESPRTSRSRILGDRILTRC